MLNNAKLHYRHKKLNSVHVIKEYAVSDAAEKLSVNISAGSYLQLSVSSWNHNSNRTEIHPKCP